MSVSSNQFFNLFQSGPQRMIFFFLNSVRLNEIVVWFLLNRKASKETAAKNVTGMNIADLMVVISKRKVTNFEAYHLN